MRESQTFKGDDARERAGKWLAGLDTGRGITLSLWLDLWYTRRYARLRPNTRRNYEEFAEYLRPLYEAPLASLTADDWQRHIDGLLERYSRGTIVAARSIWSGALAAAVREGYIVTNPLLDTRLPRATEEPPKAWAPDEVQRLLAGAAEAASHYQALLHLALASGLRLGEMRALLWSDLDLRACTVTVFRSLDNATDEEGPTKSGRVRTVDLPPETVAILAAHRKRQDPGCQLVLGKLFGPYDVATFRTWLRRLCKRVGVTELPPHATRHTFASLAIARGVPIPEVSAALGHANPAITARIYAHFIEQHARRTSRALSAALYGTSAPTSARETPATRKGEHFG